MKNVMVILNYNDYKTTLDYLEMIKKYKNLDLIIIVDNNSTDNSYDELKKINDDKIVVLKSNKNGGYGYGNNIGIKFAIKKYKKCNIIISNPDIEVTDDTIKQMSKYLNNNSNVAIVSPVIKEHGSLNRGWKLSSGYKEMLLSVPLIGRKLKNKIIGYKNSYYKNDVSKVDVISGCFFMIKSDIFKEIDYFDENLFLYYEENVICSKIKKLNYDIVILNYCSVIHNHSVSIDKSYNKLSKYKILKKSQMYYLEKYTHCSKIFIIMIKLISNLIVYIKGK